MIYRFDQFELDDALYELRAGEEVRALPRKGFDLLRFLVQEAPRVLSKEEIFEHIWPSLVVSENVLPVTIRTIRLAIEDDAGVLLRTIRGRGYQISCPVTALPARAGDAAPAPATAAKRHFVGRSWVFAQLDAAFEQLSAGRGHVQLLGGEPGIGKTRTLQQLESWATARTPFVFLAHFGTDAGAPECWPWIQIAAQVERARTQPSGSPEDAPSDSGGLARVAEVEQAGATLREVFEPAEAQTRSDPELRFRFLQRLVHRIEQLSHCQPVVLLLDDLHAADAGSLELAHSVLQQVGSLRVLAVASYDPDAYAAGGEIAHAVARLAQLSHTRQSPLTGFDLQEVQSFIAEESSLDPTSDLADRLLEYTRGNPLFLREILRASVPELARDPRALLAAAHAPATLRDILLRRMRPLSAEVHQVLHWVAVAGPRVRVPLLERVTGLPREALLAHLEAAERARILSSWTRAGTPGEFAFRLPVLATLLYQEIPAATRMRYHAAIGYALEEMYGASSHEHAAELAEHFFQAAPTGEIDRAADYAMRSAHLALAASDHAEVVRQQRNRLVAEELRVPRDDARYNLALMDLGHALTGSNAYAEAEQTFLRAADLARSRGDGPQMARAALAAAGDPFRRVAPAVDEARPRAAVVALLEEVNTGEAARDPRTASEIFAALARELRSIPARGRALADRAVDLARAASSPEVEFRALMAKQATLHHPADTQERLAVAHRAVGLAGTLDCRTDLAQAYAARIPCFFAIGDMERADADIEALCSVARELRLPAYSYAAARFQMCRAVGSGRFDEGSALVERVARLGDEAGDPGAPWICGSTGLFLVSMSGNKEQIRRALEALASQEAINGAMTDTFGAHFCMLTGDREDAREHFERALREGVDEPPHSENWLWNLSCLADVACYLRDRARGDQLYELLLPYAHLNVVSRDWNYRGSLGSVLARLALLRGDIARARAHMEAAIEFNRQTGAPVSVLINRFFYALLLSFGSPEERKRAERVRTEVMAEARKKGMSRYLEHFG